MKRLENKVAVVYGDGAIGSATAKAFAREGASVFFTGRTVEKLEANADEILSGGGAIETTQLDALDELAVEEHMREVIKKAGKIDISFNAIGVSQKGIQSLPLTELSLESFSLPVTTYTQSHFVTAKTAAIRMIKQGYGMIIMHTPNASQTSPPFAGGLAPAWAAMEALCRGFSVECGPYGVRTVCLLTTAIPETPLINELLESRGKAHHITLEQFRASMEGTTHRKRLTSLQELTNAAIFVASDEGSAITGTVLNLTGGMIA
jgi:NAD(P)-dependent dehydrogenase (short-subunit alcohol dehydrogenase family)